MERPALFEFMIASDDDHFRRLVRALQRAFGLSHADADRRFNESIKPQALRQVAKGRHEGIRDYCGVTRQ